MNRHIDGCGYLLYDSTGASGILQESMTNLVPLLESGTTLNRYLGDLDL